MTDVYLTSSVDIQGSTKPARYVLIYDEIGLKLSELELLTYWTTQLYQRCTILSQWEETLNQELNFHYEASHLRGMHSILLQRDGI